MKSPNPLHSRRHVVALDGEFIPHISLKCALRDFRCYTDVCHGGRHFLEYQFQLREDGGVYASRFRTAHSACRIDRFSVSEWECVPETIHVELVKLIQGLLERLADRRLMTHSQMEAWVAAAVDDYNARIGGNA